MYNKLYIKTNVHKMESNCHKDLLYEIMKK